MYSTKKISPKNLSSINGLMHIYKLSLTKVIKRYGIRFTLQLIKTISPRPNNGNYDPTDSVYLIKPKEIENLRNKLDTLSSNDPRDPELEAAICNELETKHDDYIELLSEAGFTFAKWNEDFIDEDTGEVVTRPRIQIKKLIPPKNPA